MAFAVLPGSPTMSLGMPFFLFTEPQVKWESSAFVIQEGATTHILRAVLLTSAEKELSYVYAHVGCDDRDCMLSC